MATYHLLTFFEKERDYARKKNQDQEPVLQHSDCFTKTDILSRAVECVLVLP